MGVAERAYTEREPFGSASWHTDGRVRTPWYLGLDLRNAQRHKMQEQKEKGHMNPGGRRAKKLDRWLAGRTAGKMDVMHCFMLYIRKQKCDGTLIEHADGQPPFSSQVT